MCEEGARLVEQAAHVPGAMALSACLPLSVPPSFEYK